jgi:SAM-dependent methyltransferase
MGDDDIKGSPDRFGYSWERFSTPTPAQEEQFRRWTIHLSPVTDWSGKTFLDAGCGAGRNSYWAMSYGASRCVAIDLDERSLAAAKRNLANFQTADVRKCSIYDIPFESEFDIVFSIGVIHHLSEPDRAVRNLVKAAKPGGQVLIWVYGYENLELYVNVLNPLRTALFSKIPVGLTRSLANLPAALIWAMTRAGWTPLDYLRQLRSFSFAHIHHICFDQMLPRIANYWTRDQAVSLLQRAGLHDVRVAAVNHVSWSVIGRKPESRRAS